MNWSEICIFVGCVLVGTGLGFISSVYLKVPS